MDFEFGDSYSAGNPYANIGGKFYQYSDEALTDLADQGFFPGNLTTQSSSVAYDPPGGGFFGPGGGPFGNPLTMGLFGANVAASMNAANQSREAALGTAAGQVALNKARREQADYNIANNMADRAAQFGWGADLNWDREERAFNLANEEFRNRQLFGLDLKNSPAAREAAQFANKLAIEQSLANRLGQTAAMFGSSAPINISTLTV
jgi:hypothetical protein